MRILIAIHGAHCLPEQRSAQRETWIAQLDGRADFRYFLGRPLFDEPDVEYVDQEDGPVYSDSTRVFRTPVLHRKTEALARYALEHGYDFVFKCDDDTYIHVENLLLSGLNVRDYSGNMEKLFSFPDTWYSYANGGAGYWLSRKAMKVVAGGIAGYPAEDGAVGFTLHRAGVQAVHDPRYFAGISPGQAANPPADAVTLHKCNPERMRVIHRALHKDLSILRA